MVACALALAANWSLTSLSAPASAATSTVVALSGGQRVMQSTVATADFDGDGDREIVVGGIDGQLHVVAYNGATWSQAWSRQTALDLNAAGAPQGSLCVTSMSDVRSSPAIADLDNDGYLEIVVTTGGDPANHRNGGVLVYRYADNDPWSFTLVPNWPQPRIDAVGSGSGSGLTDGCWDGIWGSPALGDLDGDGDLEVVVLGFDRRIHAWHHDGSAVTGWPIYRDNGDALLRGGWGSPALGDIDGDGLVEVVVGTDSPPWEGDGGPAPDYSKATVWAINGDSTNVPGWPVVTDNNIQSSPALGDIDGDGELEVVVGSGTTGEGGDGHRVYAWNSDGLPVSGWPKTTDGDMPAPPALGDIDGDGDLEVVIGCGTEADASCTWLYAWHDDGQNVTGFPMRPVYNSWDSGYRSMPYSPVLADYDGDGTVEILITHRDAFGLATVRNGTSQNDATLKTSYTLFGSPLVDDVDDDGKLEIVVAGVYGENPNGDGAVYIWEVEGDAGDALPWPMFHQNVRRTGESPTPPSLSFPDEVRVYHQYGSGDTETGRVAVRNGGDGEFEWSITHGIGRLQLVPDTGTVETSASVQVVITTTGLVTGWHDLGTLTVSGTSGGEDIDGSPLTSSLRLYVGDVHCTYLPFVLRNG
jgi:hypothetical protein